MRERKNTRIVFVNFNGQLMVKIITFMEEKLNTISQNKYFLANKPVAS